MQGQRKNPAGREKRLHRFLMNTEEGLAICETLMILAQRLGLKVIAEGIETAKQFCTMNRVGSDWIQGYLIARPLPADQVDQFAQSFDWEKFKTDNGLQQHPPRWTPFRGYSRETL